MSDGADIDESLGVVERVDELTFFGRDEVEAFGEDAWDMGVALEAVAFDECKDPFHLSLVVDVFGEDVFIERIACGAVYEHQSRFPVDSGEFTEKVPAFFVSEPVAGFELCAGPEDGSFGSGIEPFGVEQCSLIVVPQQAHGTVSYPINAFSRVGSIADDIAQAVDLLDRFTPDVFEHGFEGFEVAVDVADEGSAHEGYPREIRSVSPHVAHVAHVVE